MKKLLSVILAATMLMSCAFAFSGCSKGETASYDIVLITDGATVSDKAYNQMTWDGVKSFADKNNMTCRYYQPSLDELGVLTVDTVAKYIDLAVNNGAKYIVLPGESFAVSAYEVCPTYSDINFILVDAYPHSQDDPSLRLQSNVQCISFDALQAGFLAGYSSVIDGKTRLGYLGSVKSENSGDYGAGFVQGAACAADQFGTPVVMDYADYDSALLNYDYSFTVKAVYQKVSDVKETTFKVNVVDGIGSGVYTDGENVTITANPAPQGKVFDHWEVKSDTEGVKDKKVNISSKKNSSMNLLVGDCDCTITAVWADADTVSVTVPYSTLDSQTQDVYYVPKNSSTWIKAPAALPGFVFDHWDTSDESAIEDINSAGTSVTVTENDITVTPVYTVSKDPTFNVTVENGTGTGSYVAGDVIDIVADSPKDGYMFYKWENIDNQGLSTGIEMDNEYCYTTNFEMIDRFASIPEKMYDDGVQVIFGGGNPLSDSIFTATWEFDYPVNVFGSGYDEKDKGNCYASVVNDYGKAVELALADFKGGSFLIANCSNDCIYVTGKTLDSKDEEYNEDYAKAYTALANNSLSLVNVQSGADVRKAFNSKCLTLNYWVVD